MPASEVPLLELLAFQANLSWPWQVLGDALGVGGLAFVLYGGPRSGLGVTTVLALLWVCAGVLTALAASRQDHLLGLAGGAALWTQGLLFLTYLPRSKLVFECRRGPVSGVGIAIACYALFGHALVTWALCRLGCDGVTGGLTPSLLVVYTIGMLALTRTPVSPVLLVLPLMLALTGTWCIATQQLEQVALLISGVVGVWLMWPWRSGPHAGEPARSGAIPLERGWSLDLREEP